MPSSIRDEHIRRNRTTRERWDTMSLHRERVMGLLEAARRESATSLCLLGVGNGNDVDLAQLAGDFERIALIDLDAKALVRVVGRVPDSSSRHIERRGGFDLTGILPALEAWQGSQVPRDVALSAEIQLASEAPAPSVGRFDVVASTCVLTQLIDSVCMALTTHHPRFIELLLAVRNRHLEMIVELLHAGGMGIVVSDFVSTQTAPELAQWNESQFAPESLRLIQRGNFFTGANPYSIADFFQKLPTIESVQTMPPWKWDIGAKQFAVSAVTFRRKH